MTSRPTAELSKGARDRLLEHLRAATIGEYEILMELGSGGMATVFLAHDLQLDRRVAIKLMHPALLAGEDMVERFILEARTAAGLSHPNIVPIHAVKVQEDLLFFVMKYIEGRPLDSMIKSEAPLSAEVVREIVAQVAEALDYAHRRGVVHRDIKPANIIISTDGHPILADFGIAKVAHQQGLTLTGATIGTPTYMSPEQCNAEAVTGASDQYSLGVTAYEMLTGKPPFDSSSYVTIMMQHMSSPPPPIRDTVPECPSDLVTTIERMLAKEPGDRFAEMGHVATALKTVTVSDQQTVRTRLVQFAMSDPHRERVKRLSVPASPIPTGARRPGRMTAAGSRLQNPLVIAGLLMGGAIFGALLVRAPWRQSNDSPAPTHVQQDSAPSRPAVVPPAAPASADSASPTPQAPAPAAVAPPRPGAPPAAEPAEREILQTVARVRLSAPDMMTEGSSGVVRAELQDRRFRAVLNRVVDWSSSAPEVVSINAAGLMHALRPGQAVITGSIDGVKESISIHVIAEPVTSLTISPTETRLSPGESSGLGAVVTGSTGLAIQRPVEWSSSAPAIATVSRAGVVTGVAGGKAVITASSGGKSASATVTVTARPATPDAPPPPAAAPTEDELRAQVGATIAAYARALERRDLARVQELYPGSATPQLEATLASMENLQVRLVPSDVQLDEKSAVARVTGEWSFTSKGQRGTLPANDRYRLERQGNGWIIVEVKALRGGR